MASYMCRSNHSPIYECGGQYKSAVWYQTEAQRDAYIRSRDHQLAHVRPCSVR